MNRSKHPKRAQTAIEYMVILGAITAVALTGFSKFLPKTRDLSLTMFNKTVNEVYGQEAARYGKARTYATNTQYP